MMVCGLVYLFMLVVDGKCLSWYEDYRLVLYMLKVILLKDMDL